MALMAAKGEIKPMPVAAIFADTKNEEKHTYDWLDVLEKELPFPVYRVSKGDLGADFLAALKTEQGRCGQPPFFVKSSKDASVGVLWRKCTQEYKLAPIRRKVRELMEQAGADSVNTFRIVILS
jgi:3'-phosphoadenosine 5'-phosphosulfate sulfotransferase (PAPS reductase)/FAD synthetase